MTTSAIEKLFLENKDLLYYLRDNRQVSFQSQLDDTFKKVLLLACASDLEHKVMDILTDFTTRASNYCVPLVSFIKNKAISRQFHTYFDWEGTNANKFFSFFGEDLKKEIKSDISLDDNLDEGIKAFLEIGNVRNTMVHEDYATFYLDKTAEEVFALYVLSLRFITYLTDKLSQSITLRHP
jgi:hypothetical protein